MPKSLCVFFLVLFAGCKPPIDVDSVFPDASVAGTGSSVPRGLVPGAIAPAIQGEKFLPEHRRILVRTGWLAYASSNIDSVQYYPYETFSSPNGLAVGLARVVNGRRIAYIALKNRTDAEVCETIVHEAGHLSGVAQIGAMFDEQQAQAVAARFWEKWLGEDKENH